MRSKECDITGEHNVIGNERHVGVGRKHELVISTYWTSTKTDDLARG